jgi:hypothetical protein
MAHGTGHWALVRWVQGTGKALEAVEAVEAVEARNAYGHLVIWPADVISSH